MKKIIIVIMASMMVFIIGCGRSDLQEYNNALEETLSIQKYESEIQVVVKNEFDMTAKEFKNLRDKPYHQNTKLI